MKRTWTLPLFCVAYGFPKCREFEVPPPCWFLPPHMLRNKERKQWHLKIAYADRNSGVLTCSMVYAVTIVIEKGHSEKKELMHKKNPTPAQPLLVTCCKGE